MIKSKDLAPGTVVKDSVNGNYVLHHRKADNSGWWNDEREYGGFADDVLDGHLASGTLIIESADRLVVPRPITEPSKWAACTVVFFRETEPDLTDGSDDAETVNFFEKLQARLDAEHNGQPFGGVFFITERTEIPDANTPPGNALPLRYDFQPICGWCGDDKSPLFLAQVQPGHVARICRPCLDHVRDAQMLTVLESWVDDINE